jgi:hypothetical protein
MESTAAFREYSQRLEGDVREMADDVISLVSETQEFAHSQLATRPYTTLGVCAAVGYFLGAGMPRWLMRLAVPVIGRAVATSLTQSISSGISAARPSNHPDPDMSSGLQKETAP